MSTLSVQRLKDNTTAKTLDMGYVTDGVAKATLHLDQATTTTINASMNVSSVTDVTTGTPKAFFTSVFADAHYTLGATTRNAGVVATHSVGMQNAAWHQLSTITCHSGALADYDDAHCQWMGDLA